MKKWFNRSSSAEQSSAEQVPSYNPENNSILYAGENNSSSSEEQVPSYNPENNSILQAGEKSRLSDEKMQELGARAIEGVEDQKNGVVETKPTLNGVLDMLDETEFTEENLDALVAGLNIPQDEKDEVKKKCLKAGNYNALGDTIEYYSMSEKERKRLRVLQRLKPVMGVALAFGILAGGGTLLSMLRSNQAQAQGDDGQLMPPGQPKVEAVDESYVDEDLEEEEETFSVLDGEFPDTNFDNYDISKIGDEFVERYVDKGEGYSEDENGFMMNLTDYFNFAEKTSKVAYNTRISEEAMDGLRNGDRSLYIDEVMTRFGNNPANAASHLALIDPAMERIGVPDEIRAIEDYSKRAQAVLDFVRASGGEKQKEMLAALYVVYMSDDTEFDVRKRTGEDKTMYLTVDDDGTLILHAQDRIERNDADQVMTKVKFTKKGNGIDGGGDGGSDVEITFIDNVDCGLQETDAIEIVTRNRDTGEEETKIVTLEFEKEEQGKGSTSTTSTGGGETPAGDTPSEKTEEEIIKEKSEGNLIAGALDAQATAGSKQQVTKSDAIYENPIEDGVLINTDGMMATVEGGKVNVVIDTNAGKSVNVDLGEEQAAGTVTNKSADEVAAAVNEGREKTDISNADIDALVSGTQP